MHAPKTLNISLDKQPGNQPPDKHRLNFLLGICQCYKTLLVNLTPDTPSRKLLIHISENVLLRVGEYVINYINSLEMKNDD